MLRSMLSATALAFVVLVSPATAQEMKMPRTLTLVGHGEVRMEPDVVMITVGVMNQGTTAAEALAANTAAMTAVFDTLKAAGVEPKDTQTSNFMVQPRYDYNNNIQLPRLIGYDVSNNVTITMRQIDALGGLLDKLVQAGSNQIQGITFQISSPEAALDEARKRATEDASHKARLYAGAMNVSLGAVQSISEGVRYEPPVPMRMKAARAEAMSADVPIAGGEQVLAVHVNITWEIQ
jgi:uncharacterized protein